MNISTEIKHLYLSNDANSDISCGKKI